MNLQCNPRPPSLSKPAVWIAPEQRDLFEKAGTTAHRLASGSGGWVERLGDDVIVSHRDDASLDELLTGLAQWSHAAQWSAARVFTRFLTPKNADRVSPILHSGDAAQPWTSVVTEAGVRYALDIGAGYSHGLFLDQRLNRARLRTLRPARTLNTFAYTCCFSVVAALGGGEVVSVDLSRKSLDRGRQNFAINDLPETRHRFVTGDALALLPRMAARGERFDAIILDPPTFSVGEKGRRWQVEHDFEALLDAALEVAMPRCAILLSTNCAALDTDALVKRARTCAKGKHRTADYISTGTLPDFPAGHGASTMWMMVR